MHIRGRRRSIDFDGRKITLKIAVKYGVSGSDRKYEFPVRSLTGFHHQQATAWKRGRLEFTAPALSSAIVTDVPLFADKLPGNVFEYGYGDEKRVSAFVAAVNKARG
ncbi:hypothetical protein [Amycolatopsis sp. NPDC051372]|uniref:hypothetical protein n=1 Tax=Amycolatopsis sp. NPDC051372 TaxID=3155669 RepID=UPI00344A3A80